MVVMAEAYGADARLVALMQYLRVVMVTLLASLVAGLWEQHGLASAPPESQWLAWHSSANITATLALIAVGLVLARYLRLPAGAMLLPLLGGIALQSLGWMTIELPAPLLGLAYALLGWNVGLRFTRPILLHAWSALPHVLASILALMALGLLLAGALYLLGGFDPLTAYLATSPGGADSVAVIAAHAAVDAGFVMAMQLARFLMVFLFGPRIFQWIARRATRSPDS
jgi:membrane AbrB-like protein